MRAITVGAIAGGAALVGAGAFVAHKLATRHDVPKEGPTPGTPTYPWIAGNDVDLKVNYDEFIPSVLDDLRSAHDVINIAEYNWEPTGPSVEIAKILKAKARAGVEVNVMTDKRGSFGVDSNADAADVEAYFDDLKSAGVNVIVHDPGGNLNPFGLFLDHRKMFDIDHRVSYTGGLGLAGSETGKYQDWHDLMLRIEGPAAAQAGAEFIYHWGREGGTVSARQHEAFANSTSAGLADATASARMLPNTPGVGLDATEDIMKMLDGPGERVWAMTPYIGDEQVQQAMVRAAKSGKDVRVLVPSAESGSNGPQLKISRMFYRELLDAGVRVYEYPTMMHAKAWLGDDQLTVGSTNLSDGALDEYLEMSAAVKDDPETLAKAEAMLEADFARSNELSLDDFGFGDRVAEQLRDVTHLEFSDPMNDEARRVQRAYLTLMLGNTLAASFIWGINTLFLLDAGLSNVQAFAANAFFTAGMMLFEIPTGVVADTAGRRTSYLLGTVTLAATTVAYWAMWLTEAPFWAWAVVSVLLGLGFTFFSGAVEAWLVDALTHAGFDGALETVLGRGQVASGIAMLGGSIAGGVIAQATNLGVPFLLRGLVLLVMFVVAARVMHDEGFEPDRTLTTGRAVRRTLDASIEHGLRNPPVRWVMLAAPFTAGVGFYAFYAMQPYLLELWGTSDAYSIAGLAAAIVAGAQVVGGLAAPRLRQLFRRRTSALVAGVVVSVTMLALLGLTSSFWIALALLTGWAMVFAASGPIQQAYLNDMIPSRQRATVLSFASLTGSSGGVVIQPVLGRAADANGYATSLVMGAAIQLLAAPLLLLSGRQHHPADVAVQIDDAPAEPIDARTTTS